MDEDNASNERRAKRPSIDDGTIGQHDSGFSGVTRRGVLATSGALVAGGLVAPVSADTRGGNSHTPAVYRRSADAPARRDVSLDGIESLLDQQMAAVVANGAVVGATAAVVRSDETILTKGYGQTHRNDGDSVDGDTLFRVGSVSKPFVWTAAMQLIESERIDPDEDVQTYLDSVSIADTHDEPITMAHLATHTAGFEGRNLGLWVSDPDDIRPLAEVLDEEQPARVRRPGEVISYSNYGAALAGQVVANVASQPLEEYIEERVFEPLGMSTATFGQPPPTGSAGGYTAAVGTPTAAPRLAVELWPAGSLTASATDMSRFMRAHLADGSVGGGRLLSAGGVRRMQDQWFTHHPAIDGVGFGWFEDTHGDVRTLWHNGSIPGSFYSHLLLLPEADVGLFIAYNTNVGNGAASDVIDDFLATYVPQEEPSREPSGRPDRADALEGTYRAVRTAETTHSRLITTVQAGEIAVTVDDDGYVTTEIGGETTRWVERESLVFDEAEGHETLAFGGRGGELTHLYLGPQAFRRRSESLALHSALGAGSTVGMLSGGVGWPALRGWRRFRRRNDRDSTPSEETEDGERRERRSVSVTDGLLETLGSPSAARWTIGGSIASVFALVVGFGAGVLFDPTFLSDPPLWYRLLLVLPVLATLGTVVSIGSAAIAWHSGSWSRRSLFHYSIVALSTGVACWLLYYWNLFGTPG